MRKFILLLGLAFLTACSSRGVYHAPRSPRTVATPRSSNPIRQNAVVLLTNECSAVIKAFIIDHTDVPIATVLRDSSHTVELRRPFFAGMYGYDLYLLVKAYDSKGKQIGSVTGGPWQVEANNSGFQIPWTVKQLNGDWPGSYKDCPQG